MNEPVRLLHLSDIHFRGRAQWDADPVLRALARYIADEVRDGLEPDLVVITGDLAFAGRKEGDGADWRLALLHHPWDYLAEIDTRSPPQAIHLHCDLILRGHLPTEHEWEAAARGPQGYEYPWGGEREDGICNSDAAGLGVTSPVGLFPRSAQVQLGLEDPAGNCWEWCDDFYDADKREGGSPRVLRGGAFDFRARNLRCADRDRGEPGVRYGVIGFRCAVAAPRQP